MATVKEIVEDAYAKVNGEFETLTESSDDFKTYLNKLNRMLDVWVQTPYVRWQSLFVMNYEMPDVVATNKLHYDFPAADVDRIHIGNTPFDAIYFIDDDGLVVGTYELTDQAFFDASQVTSIGMIASDGLYLKGLDPKFVGCKIRLPVYKFPIKYTAASQTVRIDSVSWLVNSMAASIADASPVPFIARNADKYAKEAAIDMKAMKFNNKKKQHLVIKSVTGADRGQVVNTDDLISLLGVNGILGTGGGGGVIDGGGA